jgi:hypothetical protein
MKATKLQIHWTERAYYGFLRWWARRLPGHIGESSITYIDALIQFRHASNRAASVDWYDDTSHEAMLQLIDRGMQAVRDFNGELISYYAHEIDKAVAARVVPRRIRD